MLETAADLDDAELADLTRVLTARQAACRAIGQEAESEFYVDVVAALGREEARRQKVLASVDQAISWYEAHTDL